MSLLALTDADWDIWQARCRQELRKRLARRRSRTAEEREWARHAAAYDEIERRSGPPAVGFDHRFSEPIFDYTSDTIGKRETG